MARRRLTLILFVTAALYGATSMACAGPVVAGKFRWPARRGIVTAPCDAGAANGLTLRLPRGAAIHAAAAGRVAYAGRELKGFDALILIRHDGGWVSAYALSGPMLVKRGDVVGRGQIIARVNAGRDGSPTVLRFELRHGAATVDPARYLEGGGPRKAQRFCAG
jgi:murein DD-endopeptidase MepM/ murein hydrolase activator NlpD